MNEFEVFIADQAALEIARISDYLKNVFVLTSPIIIF